MRKDNKNKTLTYISYLLINHIKKSNLIACFSLTYFYVIYIHLNKKLHILISQRFISLDHTNYRLKCKMTRDLINQQTIAILVYCVHSSQKLVFLCGWVFSSGDSWPTNHYLHFLLLWSTFYLMHLQAKHRTVLVIKYPERTVISGAKTPIVG